MKFELETPSVIEQGNGGNGQVEIGAVVPVELYLHPCLKWEHEFTVVPYGGPSSVLQNLLKL